MTSPAQTDDFSWKNAGAEAYSACGAPRCAAATRAKPWKRSASSRRYLALQAEGMGKHGEQTDTPTSRQTEMTDRLFDAHELKNRMTKLQGALVEQKFHGAVLSAAGGRVVLHRRGVSGCVGARARRRRGCRLRLESGEPHWARMPGTGERSGEALAKRCGQSVNRNFASWTKIGTEEDVLPVAMWRQFSMSGRRRR